MPKHFAPPARELFNWGFATAPFPKKATVKVQSGVNYRKKVATGLDRLVSEPTRHEKRKKEEHKQSIQVESGKHKKQEVDHKKWGFVKSKDF